MSTPGIAVPGAVVPSGSLTAPGGAQGLQGLQGPTAVSTDAGNQAVLGSDSKIYVPDPTPTITSVRLRSFNAVGNPNFEIDQRNVGNAFTIPTSGNSFAQDRWMAQKTGGMTATATYQQTSGLVALPGTNFNITQKFARITLTANQGAVASGDYLRLFQSLEGPCLRELVSDVHSIQVLVRSTVAPLSFSIALQNPSGTWSLTLLATISSANTWVLLSLPNIAVFTPSNSWSTTPGIGGYFFFVTLAAGSNYQSPSNGVWANTAYLSSPGQSNFAASAVNSTFDIAFVQHEPGPVCTTPIEKSFTQNLDECLRYYQKTYDYATLAGTVTSNGAKGAVALANGATTGFGIFTFPKIMAKTPTVTLYNHSTGTVNSVQDGLGVNHASASVVAPSQTGFAAVTFATGVTAATQINLQYTADTGW